MVCEQLLFTVHSHSTSTTVIIDMFNFHLRCFPILIHLLHLLLSLLHIHLTLLQHLVLSLLPFLHLLYLFSTLHYVLLALLLLLSLLLLLLRRLCLGGLVRIRTSSTALPRLWGCAI